MKNPYVGAPAYRFWPSAVGAVPAHKIDPVVSFPVRITRNDAVVTAGSCFAQHISRRLREGGFNFLVTETPHPLLEESTATELNYGVFSARYGNIYTSRQLLQLMRRAYGGFKPADDVWEVEGGWIDPFRPRITPWPAPTLREFELDRERHFQCVRLAFEQLEIFVFTLGLTELWRSREDGAAYPLAPGVAGGLFNPEKHEFHNLSADEVVEDMSAFIQALRTVNPRAKVILTVSPVPLTATAEDRHVLTATAYSKSVLRVAAEMLSSRLEAVYYFPSYEIITGAFSRGAYFGDDLRAVTEAGVEHVMSLFFRHATDTASEGERPDALGDHKAFERRSEQIVEVLCEEELLAQSRDDVVRLTS